jgi:DNA-binding PadR family transcriptional regulator
MSGIRLGQLERLIILAVLQLGDNAYGVTIQKVIEEATEKPLSVAQLYVALGRLADKGALSARLGPPTRVRGGKAKRLYSVTAEGEAALRQTTAADDEHAAALRRLVGAWQLPGAPSHA